MRLARQHFELEQKQKEDERRRRERDNEEAARKFQELEIGTRKGMVTNGTGKTPTPQQVREIKINLCAFERDVV